MPYRYRRKPYRRPRKFNRRKRYSRRGTSRMKRGNQIHYIKRSGDLAVDFVNGGNVGPIVAAAPGTDTIYNLAFELNSLPGAADFTALFDQYRIKAIKVNFIPLGNVSSWTTGITGTNPFPAGSYAVRSWSALDFNDDNNPPTSIAGIQEYGNAKWKPYNRVHSRYFYPRITLSNGAGQDINFAGKQPWIQCSNSAQRHYGIIFGVDASTAPMGTALYKLEYKMYLQFRSPR